MLCPSGNTTMGRISNFHGQMRTQISFVLEGRPGEHRATMVKEKTRNCTWILPAIHCFYYIRKLFQRQIFFPKFLWYENIIKSNLWNFQARRRRCHQFEDTIFCVIKFLFGNIRLAVWGTWAAWTTWRGSPSGWRPTTRASLWSLSRLVGGHELSGK